MKREYYYINDKYHREDGPAIIFYDKNGNITWDGEYVYGDPIGIFRSITDLSLATREETTRDFTTSFFLHSTIEDKERGIERCAEKRLRDTEVSRALIRGTLLTNR